MSRNSVAPRVANSFFVRVFRKLPSSSRARVAATGLRFRGRSPVPHFWAGFVLGRLLVLHGIHTDGRIRRDRANRTEAGERGQVGAVHRGRHRVDRGKFAGDNVAVGRERLSQSFTVARCDGDDDRLRSDASTRDGLAKRLVELGRVDGLCASRQPAAAPSRPVSRSRDAEEVCEPSTYT